MCYIREAKPANDVKNITCWVCVDEFAKFLHVSICATRVGSKLAIFNRIFPKFQIRNPLKILSSIHGIVTESTAGHFICFRCSFLFPSFRQLLKQVPRFLYPVVRKSRIALITHNNKHPLRGTDKCPCCTAH